MVGALPPFAERVGHLALSFASVGSFPGSKGVAFLAPVMTAELAAVHERFHAELAAFGSGAWPHYLPGRWVPHCTIAFEFDAERRGEALEVGLGGIGAAEVREVGLVRFDATSRATVVCCPVGD